MNLRWNGAAVILSVIVVPSSSNAFVSPMHSDFSSSLFMGPPSDLVSAPDTDFGEGSRKNRRTVYTHDQWVKHRSSDRFINNLKTLPNSDIYKQIGHDYLPSQLTDTRGPTKEIPNTVIATPRETLLTKSDKSMSKS